MVVLKAALKDPPEVEYRRKLLMKKSFSEAIMNPMRILAAPLFDPLLNISGGQLRCMDGRVG
jgi:hypothetical protein